MDQRYERNLLCNNFSHESQRLLLNSNVLVVGGGGLGSYVLQHLAAVGVGTIGVAEFDKVSISNLNRQILYTTSDIGSPKIDRAQQRLSALNPTITVVKHPIKLTCENIDQTIANYEIVVDCTDNFEIRYIMDSACESKKRPFVHASVSDMRGSVTTFRYINNKNYKTLFGSSQSPHQPSSPLGVLSPIVGTIGSIQAAEVIKIITGIGTPLYEKLLTIDLITNSYITFDY